MSGALVGFSIGVFVLGATLCGFFMVFLIRGRPIAGDRGARQVIKFHGLELETNSIMLLLIVSLIAAASPMVLYGWLRLKQQALQETHGGEAKIYLSGELADASDPSAKLAGISVTATNGDTQETRVATSDQQGSFEFEGIRITDGANHIRLLVEREGYLPFQKVIPANEQNVRVTLSRKP